MVYNLSAVSQAYLE